MQGPSSLSLFNVIKEVTLDSKLAYQNHEISLTFVWKSLSSDLQDLTSIMTKILISDPHKSWPLLPIMSLVIGSAGHCWTGFYLFECNRMQSALSHIYYHILWRLLANLLQVAGSSCQCCQIHWQLRLPQQWVGRKAFYTRHCRKAFCIGPLAHHIKTFL